MKKLKEKFKKKDGNELNGDLEAMVNGMKDWDVKKILLFILEELETIEEKLKM